ncbi:hypothetical protein EUX98_g3678 [Antrodiella citrinella]|uniref:Uncharacterized protein n=1 Tax=Antrodiella citrinella TaxID=2447956 RepID=A0A4S4MVZ2_9APHY|nr:hypothetical protein EUX98_g3678 [Antrodiella citrinella]
MEIETVQPVSQPEAPLHAAEAVVSSASTSVPSPSSMVPQKRKDPPAGDFPLGALNQSEAPVPPSESVDTNSTQTDKDEYETGRVLCEACGEGISFRDEASGTFTVKHWDAHRIQCPNATQHAIKTVSPPPEPLPEMAAQPQSSKRRRPKRTEEERIAYLRDDPYVGQFEAYRVFRPTIDSVPPPSKHLMALVSSSALSNPSSSTSLARARPQVPVPAPPAVSPSFKDLTPGNFVPAQESRRRNAEQREAALRSDPLIGEVQPNQVFCSICRKWVQLRQDSTYCAYPWVQHRGKCLNRQNASPAPVERREEKRRAKEQAWIAGVNREVQHGKMLLAQQAAADDEASMDVDAEIVRPPRLADLESPAGRLDFVSKSIRHLFKTTYERSDDLTIATLVTYLNAAIPLDKHEDFDTTEVTKAASAISDRGDFVLEGDVLRLYD